MWAVTNRQPLWLLLGALLFLYLHLFIPPFVPLWIGGDQTVYVFNASRMLHGDVIYRDFFQFTMPGTELVYLAFFKLFGAREWVPNFLLILLGLISAALIFRISKRVLAGPTAYLPALLFLTMPYRNMLNGTHHWFSATAVLGGLAIAIERQTPRRLAGAGALCGLAALFTQARGIAAALGFIAFLLFRRRQARQKESSLAGGASFLGAFFATVLTTSAYFVVRAGAGAFWRSTIIFGLRYYPADKEANSWRGYLAGWPSVPPWHRLPTFGAWLFIYALLPLVYVFFIWRYRREVSVQHEALRDRLVLLNCVGLFLFIGVLPAPNFFRLFAASPPALILVVWLFGKASGYGRVLLNALWIFAILLALTEPWSNQRPWHGFLDLPVGRTAFLSKEAYDKYDWMLHHTRPSEYIFDASRLPGLYFPLDLRNPAKVPFLTTTDYTRPEQVQDVLDSLDARRIRLINWSASMDRPEDPSDAGDHLGPLRAYLRSHYQVIKAFPDGDQVWERTE